MSTLNLSIKHGDRGYAALLGLDIGSEYWEIYHKDGLRNLIELSVFKNLNARAPTGQDPVETIEMASILDPQVEYIRKYLYEIEATNACSVSEMMIHRPVILSPAINEQLARADFSIDLAEYENGLYHIGEHDSTDWEISPYPSMELPDFTSYNDRTNKLKILTSNLDAQTDYYIRARFRSNEMLSEWSDIVPVKTGYITTFLVRTRPMSLFCTTVVDIAGSLIGGVGSDHTLEWEQTTTEDITWNWGRLNSLVAQFSVTHFEDVFFKLMVDKGTIYENTFFLRVYRGGIEFPSLTRKANSTFPRAATIPTIRTVKDFDEGVYTHTRDNDDMQLFWQNPQHYNMRLLRWDSAVYDWVTILDSNVIQHYPISLGMYKLQIYDLPWENDVESRVYELTDDRTYQFNTFYGYVKAISTEKNYISNLNTTLLSSIGKQMYHSASLTRKANESHTINLTTTLLTTLEIDAPFHATSLPKLAQPTQIDNLLVTQLAAVDIG